MSVLAEKLVLWFQVNFDPPLKSRGAESGGLGGDLQIAPG